MFLFIRSSFSYKLHTATACFSKRFFASSSNYSNLIDIPIRADGIECGEDDFLQNKLNDIHLMNVADGVGSWSELNVDPKIFANELLKSISDEFLSIKTKMFNLHDKSYTPFLKRIISDAFRKLQETKTFIQHGSCTLVTLSLNIKTLILNSYVLGDSAFMIIRNREVYYKSKDLQHGFNWPYQLAFEDEYTDDPLVGHTVQFQLKPHDIIIIGSDGLFDNLFEEAILSYVNQETHYLKSFTHDEYDEVAKNIAKILTFEAKLIGEARFGSIVSPFSEEINDVGFLDFKVYAGKNDDTTVFVAIIS
ncbi:hypothetical protein PVAND_014005 [Polypedilum vanderplanki]|uniref:Protein phosphatase n=1 Tax=Polypedilum vanderplanki TaxID=319348 RepID=A0A9J6CS80_POLVA|nr:hypothetical protein PVAND_014005 [Polypedilum vanderplanki]